jgi:poly(3-hydroxybutyrate) depolymerase
VIHFADMMPNIISHLICLCLLPALATGREEVWTVSSHGLDVPFGSWQADGAAARTGVLVLVPGFNGKCEQMLDARWKAFAGRNGLVLLSPSFHAEEDEVRRGKGYYYPEQGSGEVMEKALHELHARTGVDTEKVLFFGFSAGAHFSHRFALWKPQRVKAFVAYSAGWWSEPSARIKDIPALVMCGEKDERYEATLDFFRKGQKQGFPWVWRSYKNTDHVVTPAVRDMAEAFLAHYARVKPADREEPRYGDMQTFKSVGRDEKEKIPEEFRIVLPSPAVADAWEKENE